MRIQFLVLVTPIYELHRTVYKNILIWYLVTIFKIRTQPSLQQLLLQLRELQKRFCTSYLNGGPRVAQKKHGTEHIDVSYFDEKKNDHKELDKEKDEELWKTFDRN